MAELSEKKLEEMVVGKPQKNNATFFEHARLDVAASKRAGHRVYQNTVYIQETSPGVRDSVSRVAKDEDKRRFPEEWDFFERNRQGSNRSPKVDIIPVLKLEHMQELIDMGLPTVKMLAETEMVPAHLEYAREAAITLHQVLQEQYNAQEESNEESRTEDGASTDRREHSNPVGQRIVSRSEDRRGKVGEGSKTSGREHHRQGQVTDNWSVTFRL